MRLARPESPLAETTAPGAVRPADRAVLGILAANAVTLAMAAWQDWGLLGLLWPYWIQSVVIGIYARRRILALERFSTDGFKMNDRAVEPTAQTRDQVAGFFLLHYGFFHFGYAVFLVTATFSGYANDGILHVRQEGTDQVSEVEVGIVGALDWLVFAVLGFGFWRSHGASHREHVAADLAGTPKIGTLMFLPYARVVPMHLTVILAAAFGGSAIWLFALLKTGADVLMHKVEHGLLQKAAPQERPAIG